MFEKVYTSNWKKQSVKIVEIQITYPIIFLLEYKKWPPIKGVPYKMRLQKKSNSKSNDCWLDASNKMLVVNLRKI